MSLVGFPAFGGNYFNHSEFLSIFFLHISYVLEEVLELFVIWPKNRALWDLFLNYYGLIKKERVHLQRGKLLNQFLTIASHLNKNNYKQRVIGKIPETLIFAELPLSLLLTVIK